MADIDERAGMNTDRELWREQSDMPGDPDNYYAPSIHVTESSGIGINVGGTVIVKTLRDWHSLAALPSDTEAVAQGQEINNEQTVLARLANGDTVVFSQDGEDAWFSKGDKAFVSAAVLYSLRDKGHIERRCSDEENYRGMSEYDTITDAGRAAIDADAIHAKEARIAELEAERDKLLDLVARMNETIRSDTETGFDEYRRTAAALQAKDARIAELEAELSDWRNGDLRGVQAHLEAAEARLKTIEAAMKVADEWLSCVEPQPQDTGRFKAFREQFAHFLRALKECGE